MKRLLAVAVLTMVTAGASGCHSCGPLARFEAWKMQTFFGMPGYGNQCCEPTVDYCDPCNDCNACDQGAGGVQILPGTPAGDTVQPGPETYQPSL